MTRNSLLAGILFTLLAVAALGAPEILAPPEHRRGEEQTFLTFPEWFLVFSPAEYAQFVRSHTPDEFVFWGHIHQFWQGYTVLAHETHARGNPLNPGYHLMIVVIGTSTTVEYAVRSAYETLIGRLTALTAADGTAEDRYAAQVALEYVDFIRYRPWYEFDFTSRLKGLWTHTAWFGRNNLRKWERKYALTTEYGVKAVYGRLIGLATHSIYEAPREVTTVAVGHWPACSTEITDVEPILRTDRGVTLLTMPRYEGFKLPMVKLAGCGAEFQEIAGNRTVILLTAIEPYGTPPLPFSKVLLRQPILTQVGRERVIYEVPIPALAGALRSIEAGAPALELEHVFDY